MPFFHTPGDETTTKLPSGIWLTGQAETMLVTCCIDKTNSAELNEAINSMFRWYRNTARCYLYLSDVSAADPLPNSQFYTSPSWEPSFRASRWFTRGWTFQELLNPASVQFFATDGSLLGNKTSLRQVIHETSLSATKAAVHGTDGGSYSWR